MWYRRRVKLGWGPESMMRSEVHLSVREDARLEHASATICLWRCKEKVKEEAPGTVNAPPPIEREDVDQRLRD